MVFNYISLMLEFFAGFLMIFVILVASYNKSKLLKCGMAIVFLSMWFGAISTLRAIIDPRVDTYIDYSMTIFSIGVILVNFGFIRDRKINFKELFKK